MADTTVRINKKTNRKLETIQKITDQFKNEIVEVLVERIEINDVKKKGHV